MQPHRSHTHYNTNRVSIRTHIVARANNPHNKLKGTDVSVVPPCEAEARLPIKPVFVA